MSFLSISISYIVYCQLDQGANFVLQKAQYDAAGKLFVRSSSTVYFPINKITPSSFRGENKINKVIILDTKKIKINQKQGNQDKELYLYLKTVFKIIY